MNEERRKILDMVAQGKITAEEAEKLLDAVGAPASGAGAMETDAAGHRAWRYLRVQVEPGPASESRDRVNIRVPFKLIRAGLKFAAFIPREAQGKVSQALKEKGMDIDLARITPKDLEDIVANLDDMTVEVDGKDKVRIFCE
jgi:SHOCT-like domain